MLKGGRSSTHRFGRLPPCEDELCELLSEGNEGVRAPRERGEKKGH